MLSCQKFKEWLIAHDRTDARIPRQMMDHARECRDCNDLYQADESLDRLLKKGMQSVNQPVGLTARARQSMAAEPVRNPYRLMATIWKAAVPVFAVSIVAFFFLLSPRSGSLISVNEVAAYSIANHLNANYDPAFLTNDITEVIYRLTRRLGHEVRLPDLTRLGLELLGGKKCNLGKVDAAYIICNRSGSRASLFVIQLDDVELDFDKIRKYILEEENHTVTVWQESGWVYALVI